jgi:hypothetical protein
MRQQELRAKNLRLAKAEKAAGGSKQDQECPFIPTTNVFYSFPGSKTQELLWNAEDGCWGLQPQHLQTPYFHPALSQDDVTRPFNKFGSAAYRVQRNLRIYLLSIVRVEPPGCVKPLSHEEPALNSEEPTGHETVWYIRVDREHQVDSRIKKTFHDVNSIYSGVLLKLPDGSTKLARVLAIVYIEWDKRKKIGEKHVSVS